MARGRRIKEGKTLAVYSTKVQPELRELLDALAKANGPNFGQRELLEAMAQAYMAANPERAQKAQNILALLGKDEQGEVSAFVEEIQTPTKPVVEAEPPKVIQTVRYIGRPQTHIYEPGSKNSTGCGLAGQIDPDTIMEQAPDAVDCKKCRYCRKAVFA